MEISFIRVFLALLHLQLLVSGLCPSDTSNESDRSLQKTEFTFLSNDGVKMKDQEQAMHL